MYNIFYWILMNILLFSEMVFTPMRWSRIFLWCWKLFLKQALSLAFLKISYSMRSCDLNFISNSSITVCETTWKKSCSFILNITGIKSGSTFYHTYQCFSTLCTTSFSIYSLNRSRTSQDIFFITAQYTIQFLAWCHCFSSSEIKKLLICCKLLIWTDRFVTGTTLLKHVKCMLWELTIHSNFLLF